MNLALRRQLLHYLQVWLWRLNIVMVSPYSQNQYPSQQRTESKTLILDDNHTILDFKDTLKHFTEYDLVVLNETKVRPARLLLQKDSGGDVEILILKKTKKYRANCLAKGLNRKNKPNFIHKIFQ